MATDARPPPEVIDLVSESDDGPPSTPTPPPRRTVRRPQTPSQEIPSSPSTQPDADVGEPLQGMFFDDVFYDRRIPGQFDDLPMPADGNFPEVPLVIDDFGYLDEDAIDPLDAFGNQDDNDAEAVHALGGEPKLPDNEVMLTQERCVARIYEMFPDVCPDHVASLYTEVGNEDSGLPIAVYLDRITEKMLFASSYPKRRKEAQQLKRKREDSVDEDQKRWENEARGALPRFHIATLRSILKAEFPTFTNASINETLAQETYLYQSYVRLADIRDTDGPFRQRGRPSLTHTNADLIAANSGWPSLTEELAAARRKVHATQEQRANDAKKKEAEEENLRRAIAAGRTAECQACFDDLPMNRQIHCHGDAPHFTCFSCMEAYIKSEIGESRCRVLCTAGCGAGFEPAQLNQLSDKQLLAKLADLQQEKDIRDAALEDLEECPFCDFKAILPPIEVDFEFRCANPECEKVSCRRCKASSHIPISCEQHAKDNKVNSRHKIEEAMTAALIRSCNRCKKQFIKEYGCNKMTCPSCMNIQCYVCSQTLKGYDHFDQHTRGIVDGAAKCPLYDNLEQRHEREIKAAENAAREEVMASNPDVQAEDLEIKMSDAVDKATEQKIRQAGPEGLGGGPMGWGGMNFLPDDAQAAQVALQADQGARIRQIAHHQRQQRLMQIQNDLRMRREQQRERDEQARVRNRQADEHALHRGVARPRRGMAEEAEAQAQAVVEGALRREGIVPMPHRWAERRRPELPEDAPVRQAALQRAYNILYPPGHFLHGQAHLIANANAAPQEQQQAGPGAAPEGGNQAHQPAAIFPPNQPPAAVALAARPPYPLPRRGLAGPRYMAVDPNRPNPNAPIPAAPNQNRLILAGVQDNLRQLEALRRQNNARQLLALQQEGREFDFDPFEFPAGARLHRRIG